MVSPLGCIALAAGFGVLDAEAEDVDDDREEVDELVGGREEEVGGLPLLSCLIKSEARSAYALAHVNDDWTRLTRP